MIATVLLKLARWLSMMAIWVRKTNQVIRVLGLWAHISVNPRKEKDLELEFNHMVNDSINHAFNDTSVLTLDTKPWIQRCVQGNFTKGEQLPLGHPLCGLVRMLS